MRKNTIFLIIIAISLAGCGFGSASSETVASYSSERATNAEVSDSEITEEAETIGQTSVVTASAVSGEIFEFATVASRRRILIKEDSGEEYGLYDEDLARLDDYKYTIIVLGQQDGAYILGYEKDDSYYSYLFDENDRLLFSMEGGEYYISGYHDNVATCTDGSGKKYFLYKNGSFESYLELNSDWALAYSDSGIYSNDFIIVTTRYIVTDNDDKYKCLLGVNSDGSTFYGGIDGYFMTAAGSYTLDDEGYMLVYLYKDDGQGSVDFSESGFYNIHSGEYHEALSDNGGMRVITGDGRGNVSVNGVYLAVSRTLESGDSLYEVRNLCTNEVLSDEYLYIDSAYFGIGEEKYIPVENLDGTWGYIDAESYEYVSGRYEAAAGFTDGYAIIMDKGSFYVVDKSFAPVIEIGYKGTDCHKIRDGYYGISVSDTDNSMYLIKLTIE